MARLLRCQIVGKVGLSDQSCDLQAAKKRDFMTGSTTVHSEVRPSMLSSARLAFTQQYGEHVSTRNVTLTTTLLETYDLANLLAEQNCHLVDRHHECLRSYSALR